MKVKVRKRVTRGVWHIVGLLAECAVQKAGGDESPGRLAGHTLQQSQNLCTLHKPATVRLSQPAGIS